MLRSSWLTSPLRGKVRKLNFSSTPLVFCYIVGRYVHICTKYLSILIPFRNIQQTD